jgi:hypothetical protein
MCRAVAVSHEVDATRRPQHVDMAHGSVLMTDQWVLRNRIAAARFMILKQKTAAIEASTLVSGHNRVRMLKSSEHGLTGCSLPIP